MHATGGPDGPPVVFKTAGNKTARLSAPAPRKKVLATLRTRVLQQTPQKLRPGSMSPAPAAAFARYRTSSSSATGRPLSGIANGSRHT